MELEGQEEKYYTLDLNSEKPTAVHTRTTNYALIADGNTLVIDGLGKHLIYTFSKPITFIGFNLGYTQNRYEDYQEFVNDPLGAIWSGKFRSNEDIARGGI